MHSTPDLDLLKTYHFDLPQDLIAQSPAEKREDARLLVVRRNPTKGMPRFEDLRVSDLPALIASEGTLKKMLWLKNTSRVVPARFYVNRKKRDQSGGISRHEAVFVEQVDSRTAKIILRGSNRFKFPEKVTLDKNSSVELIVTAPDEMVIGEGSPPDWFSLLESAGEMPLPPYITERNPERDTDRYQSIWARPDQKGSVAAPTASLHFSKSLDERLRAEGVEFAALCLHVGLGTFEPVRTERLSEHKIHSEFLRVDSETLAKIRRATAGVLSLGTTALRSLESLSAAELGEAGIERRCDIFIRPGYEFRYCRALWTNFHLPESTLFVLVAAFAGNLTLAQEAYRHAISKKYRFFSYGDASLWI